MTRPSSAWLHLARRLRTSRRHTGWSVRAHLVAAVLGVLLLLGGAVGAVALETLDDVRDRAQGAVDHQAGLAAQAVTDALARAMPTIASSASSLDVEKLLADPAACSLSAGGSQLFPDAHVDIVLADGAVPCTSFSPAPGSAGDSHAGAPWLSTGADGPAVTAMFLDPLTGKQSIALTAPTAATAERPPALVAYVLPVDRLAEGLKHVYGGPQQVDFVVTTADGQLLSASAADGGSRIRAESALDQPDWSLVASQPTTSALGPARSTFVLLAALVAGAFLLLLGLLVGLNRQIARPLRQITDAAAQAGRQVSPISVPEAGPAELRRLARRFNAMVRVGAEHEETLVHRALHDPLTGLPNRALLLDRIRVTLAGAESAGPAAAVLSVDLDRFKLVNASLGYRGGDEVLRRAAERLAAVLDPRATLARCGGDGFVLCSPSTGVAGAVALAELITAVFAEPFCVDGTDVTLSASVGVALASPGAQPEALIRDADTAMYAAKQEGGGRHRFIDDHLRTHHSERLMLEADLRAALERDELDVAYQPVVNLLTRQITGAEALLRWNHPARGPVPPLSFIPLAEETGLILPIGRRVLDRACAQAAAWNAMGHRLRVAVNVSGLQLLDPGFVGHVDAALRRNGLDADQLCLELTETTLMDDAVRVPQALADLKELGVDLSVDDFGTGYSSLAYLKRFPVDELKIDRTFVQGLGAHGHDHTLVAAMVAMGHALDLDVIAEGIEQEQQVTTLLTVGCRSAQGFLFSRPQPPERITALLQAGLPVPSGRRTAERARPAQERTHPVDSRPAP